MKSINIFNSWYSGTLLATLLVAAANAGITINEASYSGSGLMDEYGNTPDWIELYNYGPNAVNLAGWCVTDSGKGSVWGEDVDNTNYVLPNYNLAPGAFFVVFCETGSTGITWTNAPDIAAIPENALWRYTTSSPGSTWIQPSFNDASWTTATVPIGHDAARLHLDCATTLPSLPQTTYFRRKFLVPAIPATVTGLLVRVRATDGFVLYLNGTEVKRVNLPAGTLTHSTQATSDRGTTVWETFTLPTTGLNTGLASNTLAAAVYRVNSGADMVFDLSLTALINQDYPIVHLGFSLGAGEKIHLYDASGVRNLKFNDKGYSVPSGSSLGQPKDGDFAEDKEIIYDIPTPGMPNASNARKYKVTLQSEKPTFSVVPGFYTTSKSITLSTPTSGYRIYYTLDGNDPWQSSTYITSGASITLNSPAPISSGLAWIRTNPIETEANVANAGWQAPIGTISKAIVLRAIAVKADTMECSPETSGTYFIGNDFTNRVLPAISITTGAENLFGFTQGLYVPGKSYADSPEGYGSNRWGKPYANYHQSSSKQSWERPVYIELFETNASSAQLALQLGVMMHGGGSRTIPQKTLYMLARQAEYGAYDLGNYQLFPDVQNVTSYKRFLLRNNGNDWYGPMTGGVTTMMKDAIMHHLVKDLDISVMAYRPVTVYINGEYWGIHNMRESLDKHYLSTRYGLDPESVDILMHEEDNVDKDKVKIERIEGDKNSDNEYEALLDWIKDHPLGNDANYQQVQAWIDITNHADYIIAETFFGNTDWPINNCDFWRAHTNQTAAAGQYGDTRWRWMLYDLDVAGEEGAGFNMLSYLTSNKMTGKSEPAFVINELWKNQTFRNYFITRYANLLNTTFKPERMAAIINQAANAIAPEIEKHLRRWGRNHTQQQWRQAVNSSLIDYLAARHTNSWSHLDAHFYLNGTGELTVRNQAANGTGGSFNVNGIPIVTPTAGVTSRAAWSGRFFSNLAVPVKAIADSGYLFDGWVGTALTNSAPALFTSAEPITLVARFRTVGAPAYQPTPYELWAAQNFTEQELLASSAAAPDTPSGIGDYTNYALFALGCNRYAPLTPEQLAARARLGIDQRDDGLWLHHYKTPADYTILSATSLVSAVWQPWSAVETTTNSLSDTIEHKSLNTPPARFFKWQIILP